MNDFWPALFGSPFQNLCFIGGCFFFFVGIIGGNVSVKWWRFHINFVAQILLGTIGFILMVVTIVAFALGTIINIKTSPE